MTETPDIDDGQRRVTELLRSFDARAPEPLHRQVEYLVASHQSRLGPRSSRRGRRLLPLGLAAAAAAVVAFVIATGLGSGGAPPITFSQTAASTLRAATLPAPPESRTQRGALAVSVDGVPFPDWGERLGWRSTGSRTDRVHGRQITTVFYADPDGRRIGYAILAGTPAPRVGGGVVTWRGGAAYRLLAEDGAAAVTWLRNGHLCVVSGRGVSSATLLRLASWDGDGVHAGRRLQGVGNV